MAFVLKICMRDTGNNSKKAGLFILLPQLYYSILERLSNCILSEVASVAAVFEQQP
jgi:hypothetical protein